jgi:hypothetical protein
MANPDTIQLYGPCEHCGTWRDVAAPCITCIVRGLGAVREPEKLAPAAQKPPDRENILGEV